LGDGGRAGARQASLGGDDEIAARACLAAARRALWTFAPDEAAELARRGITHSENLRPEVRLELRIELLGLSVYPGMREHRFADLERELTRAIAEARACGVDGPVHREIQLLAERARERALAHLEAVTSGTAPGGGLSARARRAVREASAAVGVP
ncbi:MAG TPA: hypothetical protein VFQ22_12250, partial [Longimicrobiales bacterium]|nr:hypothetical protein [Longimicrobiales bacterium]